MDTTNPRIQNEAIQRIETRIAACEGAIDRIESQLQPLLKKAITDAVFTPLHREKDPEAGTLTSQIDTLIRENRGLRDQAKLLDQDRRQLDTLLKQTQSEIRPANYAFGKLKSRYHTFLNTQQLYPSQEQISFEQFVDAFLQNYDRLLANETEFGGPAAIRDAILWAKELTKPQVQPRLQECYLCGRIIDKAKEPFSRVSPSEICCAQQPCYKHNPDVPTPTPPRPPVADIPSPSNHSALPLHPLPPPDKDASQVLETLHSIRTQADSHHTADTAPTQDRISDNPHDKHSASEPTPPPLHSPHTQAPIPVSMPPVPDLIAATMAPSPPPKQPTTDPDAYSPPEP